MGSMGLHGGKALPQGEGAIAWFCLDGADPTLGCRSCLGRSLCARRGGGGGGGCLSRGPSTCAAAGARRRAGCAGGLAPTPSWTSQSAPTGREGSPLLLPATHTQFLGPPGGCAGTQACQRRSPARPHSGRCNPLQVSLPIHRCPCRLRPGLLARACTSPRPTSTFAGSLGPERLPLPWRCRSESAVHPVGGVP